MRARLLLAAMLAGAGSAPPVGAQVAAARVIQRAPAGIRLAPAAPKVHTVSVSGAVLDPEGHPVFGALVRVFALDPMGRQPKTLRLAADEAGQFKGKLDLPQPAGPLVVAGFVPGRYFGTLTTPSSSPGHLSLRLRSAQDVAGRVIDLEGKPIPGARVSVEAIEPDQSQRQTSAEPFFPNTRIVDDAEAERWFNATTDAAGAFTLAGLPDWGLARIKLSGNLILAPGSQEALDLTLARPNLGLLVAAHPGVARVRAKDLAGKPAPEIPVQLAADFSRATLVGLSAGSSSTVAATTAADGEALIPNLFPGKYTLFIQGRSYPLRAEPGTTSEVTVRAVPHALKGRVLSPDGKPVGKLTVTMSAPQPGLGGFAGAFAAVRAEVPVTQTGPDGSFSIPQFPWMAEKVTLRAQQGDSVAEWTGKGESLRGGSLARRLQSNLVASVTRRGWGSR
jgi:hypothetical protein